MWDCHTCVPLSDNDANVFLLDVTSILQCLHKKHSICCARLVMCLAICLRKVMRNVRALIHKQPNSEKGLPCSCEEEKRFTYEQCKMLERFSVTRIPWHEYRLASAVVAV